MRISFAMQTDTTIQSLDGKQEEISQLSNSVSTGKKLTSPADDPYAWSRSIDVQQGLREYDSILNNISFATGWNNTTSSALNQLSDLVNSARQTAISATSATGIDQKSTLANQVDGIIKQVLSVMNSKYGDQYVFGGTKTSTEPYAIDSSGNVTYSGDTNSMSLKTQRSSTATTVINLTGSDVTTYTSGGSPANLFTELSGLRDAITNGDSATITQKLATLQDAFDNINNQSGITGERLSNFSNQTSAINSIKTDDQSTLSDLQDTDLASAVVKLQQQQTAYQAALQVTGMMSKLSLTNYLPT